MSTTEHTSLVDDEWTVVGDSQGASQQTYEAKTVTEASDPILDDDIVVIKKTSPIVKQSPLRRAPTYNFPQQVIREIARWLRSTDHSSLAVDEWTVVGDGRRNDHGCQLRYDVKAVTKALEPSLDEDIIIIKKTSLIGRESSVGRAPRNILPQQVIRETARRLQ